jgi:hypothetical protein
MKTIFRFPSRGATQLRACEFLERACFFCHRERSEQRERSRKISDSFAPAKPVPYPKSAKRSVFEARVKNVRRI